MCVIGLFKHDRKSIFLWESCIVNILARWILFDEAVMACFGRWQHCVYLGNKDTRHERTLTDWCHWPSCWGVFITLLARYCDCCQHLLGSGSSLLGQDILQVICWPIHQNQAAQKCVDSCDRHYPVSRSSFPLWKYQIFTDIILLFCINWNTAV